VRQEITREYLIGLQSFETEELYRASPSLNYSTLKDIENGPWGLINDRVFAPGKAFEVGDYVDKYFTNRDLLEELYEISEEKIELSPSLETLYEFFLANKIFTPTVDECVTRCRELKLWDSIKYDSKVADRLTKDFFTKLEQASRDSGKIKMTQDQRYQAICAIGNINNSESAMALITEQEGEFIIPQFKWEFEMIINGHIRLFRVMFDWIKFNAITHKITGIDLKTGAKPSHKFIEQFLDYRYDVQGILYYFGIMALRKQYFPDWEKCTPEDFKFLYTPKIDNRKPIIVPLTETFIRQNDEYIYNNGKRFYGISKLIDDADWYIENEVFNQHRIIAENDGIVKIL
jgi:hypothetical protein